MSPAKWSRPDSGERYATQRFRTQRAEQRDPRMVERILRDHGVRGRALDVPCGAGRLQAALARFGHAVAGADVSLPMLARARAAGSECVQADVERLPFADRTFDVVVCCRLLHHLREPAELEHATAELVRVSARLVVASFWDAAAWPQWRERIGLARSPRPSGRVAARRATIAKCLENAGATVIEFRSRLRFVAQQTFVVARRSDVP